MGIGAKWIAASALAVLATVAVGCTDDGPEARGGATTTQSSSSTTSKVQPVKPATADYELGEYMVAGPGELPAGATEVTAHNTGRESHHVVFVRLENGKTQQDFLAAIAGLDATGVATLLGGPGGVGPGATSSATVSLTPGTYLIACFIPGADGVPHVLKGMTAPLTVTPSTSPTALPGADRTVHLGEYSIGHDGKELRGFNGTGTLEVVNEGAQIHELALVRLTQGSTLDDVVAAAAIPIGQPHPQPEPYEAVGGVSLLSPGASAEFDVDALKLPKGKYAFVCFIPSPDDRMAHATKGMTWQFDI